MSSTDNDIPPRLSGQQFKITVVEQSGFVNFIWNPNNDGVTFSGYAIDIIKAIASPTRANFTYELVSSSGYGEMCSPRLEKTNGTNPNAYSEIYWNQFNCGQGDVNDLPRSDTSTDFYLSSYYVTPERQMANQFTIPYAPPYLGTQGMIGTATNIKNIDDFVKQQEEGKQKAACVKKGDAYIAFLKSAFPTIKLVELDTGNVTPVYDAFNCGSSSSGSQEGQVCCDVLIIDSPDTKQWVKQFFSENMCTTDDGKPIGVIGEPMGYGLNYYAIGVGNHVPSDTVNTLSYWMNVMMTCVPGSTECPDGNFYTFYKSHDMGGDGSECGYVDYPGITAATTSDSTRINFKAGLFGNWALVVMFALKFSYWWGL